MKKSRNAIITGATAGIGLAVAREFLERGHNVFICGRDSARLAAALAGLTADFGSERIAGSTCDVRSLASVEEMVAMAGARHGGIDVLVNNAGIAFVTSFESVTPDQWHDIIDTNLTGVFNCCRAVLPWLKAAGASDIVNLGSRSGRYSFRGGTGYNTTKFGLQGFTEALFLDLHQYGIRVSLVAPGTVATGLGGTVPEEWHLLPGDVAKVVGDVIAAAPRATVNWVEIRPSRPQ
ncbi:MAG: SDR family NAD(P)-dependent oxidoreductase [Proteobacteria bacterium]|nr:SDR family NAD(P)-dependent oxidoreductase [Pseudomonadota bacterium]